MNRINFKNLLSISLMVVILVGLFSCNSTNSTPVNLKENETVRNQVYDQILNDRELTNEFMNQMMNHTHTMHWMMENEDFMRHMFNNENMEYMMQHNEHFTSEDMRHRMMKYYSDTSSIRHSNEMMHPENEMHE